MKARTPAILITTFLACLVIGRGWLNSSTHDNRKPPTPPAKEADQQALLSQQSPPVLPCPTVAATPTADQARKSLVSLYFSVSEGSSVDQSFPGASIYENTIPLDGKVALSNVEGNETIVLPDRWWEHLTISLFFDGIQGPLVIKPVWEEPGMKRQYPLTSTGKVDLSNLALLEPNTSVTINGTFLPAGEPLLKPGDYQFDVTFDVGCLTLPNKQPWQGRFPLGGRRSLRVLAIKTRADQAKALGFEGRYTLIRKNDPVQALTLYRAALDLAPHGPGFHYGVARASVRLGDFETAIAYYEKLMRPPSLRIREIVQTIFGEKTLEFVGWEKQTHPLSHTHIPWEIRHLSNKLLEIGREDLAVRALKLIMTADEITQHIDAWKAKRPILP
jgi:hypothetical protein